MSEVSVDTAALVKALREQDSSWHFDKKIPISMICALFLQSLAVVWWAGQVETRINHIEDVVSQSWTSEVTSRLVAVETTLKDLKQDSMILRMKETLNKASGEK